jgi:Ca2+:H+ antiporter
MKPLVEEIRRNPVLWLLAFVPAVFVAQRLNPSYS